MLALACRNQQPAPRGGLTYLGDSHVSAGCAVTNSQHPVHGGLTYLGDSHVSAGCAVTNSQDPVVQILGATFGILVHSFPIIIYLIRTRTRALTKMIKNYVLYDYF